MLLVTTFLASGPAAAADPTPPQDRASGKVGIHELTDTPATPGAKCKYGSIQDFGYYNGVSRVSVRPPVAYARANRASQRIGARLVVQAWQGERWLNHRTSTWKHRHATPAKAADFRVRGLDVDSWPHHHEYHSYRARINLRWYARDGRKVVGRAVLHPTHYVGVEEGNPDTPMEDRCGATTG